MAWLVPATPTKEDAKDWLRGDLLFSILIFCALVWSRWPSFIPLEFNPDESQALAAAAGYGKNPIPFLAVDGATHGPLLYYVLLIPSLLSPFMLDYGLARLVGVVLCFVTILASYFLLSSIADKRLSRLAVFILVFYECTITTLALLSYSSEMLPTALLVCLLWVLLPDRGVTPKRMVLIGTGASLLPYMKLQFVPIGAAVLLVAVLRLFRMDSLPARKKQELGLLLLASLFAIPALITLVVSVSGGWDDFWQSYILGNATHAQQIRVHDTFLTGFETGENMSFMARMLNSVSLLWSRPEGRWMALAPLLASFFCGLHAARVNSAELKKQASLVCELTLLLGACWIAILLPGTGYDHYFRIVVPLGLVLLGLFLKLGKFADLKVPALIGVLILSPYLYDKLQYQSPNAIRFYISEGPLFFSGVPFEKFQSGVSRTVVKNTRPGDFCAVWGWSPLIYVQSGTVPATPDITCERLLETRFDQDFFRKRYLRHFQANTPPVFVDAVGSYMYKDRTKFGPETFPELWKILEDDYSLVESSDSFRVWVRKEHRAK